MTSTHGNERCSAVPIAPSVFAPPNRIVTSGASCFRRCASTSDGTPWLNVEVKPTAIGSRLRMSCAACVMNSGTSSRTIAILRRFFSLTLASRRNARYCSASRSTFGLNSGVEKIQSPQPILSSRSEMYW